MNPYTNYKKQSVATMTPIEVVIRLYEECEKQLNIGVAMLAVKDLAKVNAALVKAWEVVNALRNMLDMKIPISKELDKIYGYWCTEILRGNMKKDAEVIKPLIPMVGEIRGSFVQISKMPRTGAAVSPTTRGMAV